MHEAIRLSVVCTFVCPTIITRGCTLLAWRAFARTKVHESHSIDLGDVGGHQGRHPGLVPCGKDTLNVRESRLLRGFNHRGGTLDRVPDAKREELDKVDAAVALVVRLAEQLLRGRCGARPCT
eukprot:2596760-Prymnesium_polylepis.1